MLHYWADANLLLLGSTGWYLFLSIWNLGVLIEYPEFMVLPAWTRLVPFVISAAFLSYYFSSLVVELFKIMHGETWKDSAEEIFIAYILWINVPTAITEVSYVVNMFIHTDDLIIREYDGDDSPTS